ncbi:calcium-binding protein [Sphingobium sufflavum]|uniref:calcium-binding protein n=1 Tax=Sphingobium sufflavum TaxID=1129547 RepID=UPI001F296A29|nr:calcium-binding protein [Sphingobium sufflavum]MCE7797623.1 calcium-binding protein [Sphingobium sufflavum]
MRNILYGLGLALLLPLSAHAQSGRPSDMGGSMDGERMGGMGGRGRGGGIPGGEDGMGPGRGGNHPAEMKPIKRERLDQMVEAMAASADTDRDGIVTLDELRAVLAARRDATIRARFEKIDTNHNKLIEPQEFLAWQSSLGSAAMSDRQALGDEGGPIAESLPPPDIDKTEDRILRRLIEPLSATVIVNANSNYDKGASLSELIAYERQKFDALDGNKDGFLVAEELHSLEPKGARGPGAPGGGGPGMPPPRGRAPDRNPADRDEN